jgi:ribosome-associated translation inhibitor RaiA
MLVATDGLAEHPSGLYSSESHIQGAPMHIAVSYKAVEHRQPVEAEIERHRRKLEKLLKVYAPDLVQIRGAFEKHPRRVEYDFSLNLSLPTGTLHATGQGPDVRTSVKQAFADLERQIKKHQGKLRREHQWKRRRARRAATA